jgi:DNA-binding response OmpR family regulator
MNVLVISSGSTTCSWLAQRLDPQGYAVQSSMPGPELIQRVREGRPDVAVLDGIDARPQLARMEVALLKDQSPGVRIIALSAVSSELDAQVVEQGIFCYLGGCSLEELLRAVESAARSRAEDRTHQGMNPWGVP